MKNMGIKKTISGVIILFIMISIFHFPVKADDVFYNLNLNANGGVFEYYGGLNDERDYPIGLDERLGDYGGFGIEFPLPREGFVLTGWDDADTGEFISIDDFYDLKLTRDLSLLAHWEEAWNVTFDFNGGRYEEAEEYIYNQKRLAKVQRQIKKGNNIEDNVFDEGIATKGDAVFEGWMIEDTDTIITDLTLYRPESDVTLKARWSDDKPIGFKVNVDAGDGIFAENGRPVVELMIAYNESMGEIRCYQPIRENRTLCGLTDTETGEDYGEYYYTHVPDRDMYFSINWKPVYSVIWHPEDDEAYDSYWGSGGYLVDRAFFDMHQQMSDEYYPKEISLKGKALLGWCKEGDENRTIITDLSELDPDSENTLVPVWGDGYKITVHANGGTYYEDRDYYEFMIPQGQSLKDVLFPTPITPKNMMFTYWTDAATGEKVDINDFTPESDVEFIAHWANVNVMIFKPNGGKFVWDSSGWVSYNDLSWRIVDGEKTGIVFGEGEYPIVNKDGCYDLDGWAIEGDYSGEIIKDIYSYVPTGKTVLVAQWVIKHTPETVPGADPTCTEKGYTEEIHCSKCNAVIQKSEEIPAKGHLYDDGEITKEPTYDETGIKLFTCTVCGETKTENIPCIDRPLWPFRDIAEGDTLADEVFYAYTNNIVGGFSQPDGNGKVDFKPAKNVSRSQFAIMLYNLAGKPDTSDIDFTKYSFVDVPAGTKGYNEIAWAASNNIISGYSGNMFKPNNPITRAQIAIMLKRYSDFMGFQRKYEYGVYDITTFADYNDISAGARESVQWAVDNGVLTGTPSKLKPNGSTRRDQCAAVLGRFYKGIGQ